MSNFPKLTISCQIRAGQPFTGDPYVIKKIIDSVVYAGVESLRLSGAEYIKYAKEKFPHVFVIGTKKVVREGSPTSGWVTPDIHSAREIIAAGPDMIVIDGSAKLHEEDSLRQLISRIKNESDIFIGCDIGTEEEAVQAMGCGADIVLTTFVQAKTREGGDWESHIELVKFLGSKNIPFIAEGGIVTPAEMQEMLRLGAKSVVVGKAIVDPGSIAERFVRAAEESSEKRLATLFEVWSDETSVSTAPLSAHGSSRKYFKMESEKNTALGAVGQDPRENQAFIELGRHLLAKGISVPKIYGSTADYSCYLQEYFSGEDLFQKIKNSSKDSYQPLLEKAVDLVVSFQKKGSEGWDFNQSYPYPSFDTEEIKRDFERFKKSFLLNLAVSYDKKSLEEDLNLLIKNVSEIRDEQYALMHRDFQTRNILVTERGYVMIDFQGARRGPLHYDLASLLYQSQLDYSDELRASLVEYFLQSHPELDKEKFMKDFCVIGVIRLIQSIGSYGIAGLEGKKEYFLKSIPYALNNLKQVLDTAKADYGIVLPSLTSAVLSAKENFNKKHDKDI